MKPPDLPDTQSQEEEDDSRSVRNAELALPESPQGPMSMSHAEYCHKGPIPSPDALAEYDAICQVQQIGFL